MKSARQPPVWSPLDLRAILAGIRAAWLGNGAQSRAGLEGIIHDRYAPAALHLTDSGTSALRLTLRAVWADTGAPIALPAYGCYDIATAALGAEVPFFLYDLDPRTLSPDLESLRQVLEAGARGVVVAHLFGLPADVVGVQAVVGRHSGILIEDAAQAIGCEHLGRPAGSLGALGVLSFGRGKGLTGGSGGAALVNDRRLAGSVERAWGEAVRGQPPRGGLVASLKVVAQWLLARPGWYSIPASIPLLRLGETVYRPPHPISAMNAFSTGVLTHSFAQASEENQNRRRRALALSGGVHPAVARWPIPAGWIPGWLRYPIVLPDTAETSLSDDLVRAGVACGYPSTLAGLAGFGGRRLNPEAAFPGAGLLARRLVTLPTHRFVRDAEIPAF